MPQTLSIAIWRYVSAALLLIGLCCGPARAQDNPFASGWDLNLEASNIKFQSVKNQTKVESSSFATFSGSIEPDGAAVVKVLLDSVDTKIDLRNVRMRFLFFETFKFAEATVSLQLTPDMVAGLEDTRRRTLTVPFTFDLHGVTKEMEAEIAVTLLTNDIVSVASATPLSIAVEPFGLLENITKLEEAAGGISIIPSATVTFDLLFNRRATGGEVTVAENETVEEAKPASVALEAEGNFSLEACVGRFEILSRTGNIYFRTASARLDNESVPLLTSIVDIVQRCPDLSIEVSGHTDSDGSDAANQRLSERRAQAVTRYLVNEGVSDSRIVSVGYGESKPVVANDSAYNKSRNRRIEFAVLN